MAPSTRAQVYQDLKELRRRGELPRGSLGATLAGDSAIPDRIRRLLSAQGSDDIDGDPERLIRSLEILRVADRVFADVTKAEAWLQRPNASMSGQRPIDLMQDELGAAVVRETLEQIDHGIFA
jgi:putative toxin-antitoxin system antitoxin component (TIGR02293 family)